MRPSLAALLNPGNHEESSRFLNAFFAQGGTHKMLLGLTKDEMNALHLSAYLAYNEGRYYDSYRLFQLLRTLEHTNKDFHLSFGLSARAINKAHPEALDAFLTAAFLDDKDPIPFYYAAAAYLDDNNLKAAKAALKNAKARCKKQHSHQKLSATIARLEEELKDAH